jgi:hypothetical protein
VERLDDDTGRDLGVTRLRSARDAVERVTT